MKIEIKNLTHIYKQGTPFEKKALDDINLTVNDGEFVGLIGHTGSGKSTLIQHLNGLLKPSSGEVFIGEENIFSKGVDLKEVRHKVGLVFQYPEYQLFEETVYKDIAFGLKNYKVPENEIEEKIKTAARLVGLDEELLQSSPFDLSGGQKRRAALAGVVAMEPEILILDEPAAGLDPFGRELIFREIQNLHREKKLTVILVSHSMEDIARFADRIVVMHEGKVLMDGVPAEVFAKDEELNNAGLDIPQVTRILNSIRKMGYDIRDDIFTVEEAARELIKLTGEKNA
ncbi:MAG: energy-coupling factor transporter ATPase [Clostridia bacterium]|nr:energy-coupling factor transporter ATPase [Clostridia bacterium]